MNSDQGGLHSYAEVGDVHRDCGSLLARIRKLPEASARTIHRTRNLDCCLWAVSDVLKAFHHGAY